MGKSTGTYADIIFSKESNKKLNDIIKSFGLEKDFTDEYHCTLTYSKKKLPYLKTSKGDKQDKTGNVKSKLSKLIKIKDFGHFDTDQGKNLHVILECPWCEAQFNRAIKSGATTDYPEYTAHITLMYNCKDFTYSEEFGKKFIGDTLEIIEERISPLNEDWVEDKLKEKEDDESNNI